MALNGRLLTFIGLSHPLFGWEGSPTQIDCGKKGTLILTSLLGPSWGVVSR